MAQTKPFAWYGEQAQAFAGMKANITVDTVDSFAAEGGINPGDLAVRGTDPAKQAKKASAAADKPLGVVLHIHKEPSDPYFADGASLSVMSAGDVFVVAGADVAAGDPVAYSADNGWIKGAEASANVYMAAASAGDVVRIRIKDPAAIAITESTAKSQADTATVGDATAL